jgi:UDP-N-acetylglucosamine 2-epimerase (non-hydrolysing)
MKIHLLAGARPNYMKVFPLWKALRALRPAWRTSLIHTGQHYDALMSDVFFTDFGMARPDYFLGVGSGTHAEQTARAMLALGELLERERPDRLVVVGDVNSTLAGALVAVKLGIGVAHVEAGLRSGDRTMPEEINRMATDAVSDLLLTSCRDADVNLRREGAAPERIRFVGNVMIDSLVQMLPKAKATPLLDKLGLAAGAYGLATLHRPANVDDPVVFKRLMQGLVALSARRPVVFPVHPRSRKMLDGLGMSLPPNLRLLDPVGYIDFLGLQARADFVVTDSGGIQEETSFLGIPCLTVRPNTERPVTIAHGSNRLVDPATVDLTTEVDKSLAQREEYRRRAEAGIEGWDGHAAERIVAALGAG